MPESYLTPLNRYVEIYLLEEDNKTESGVLLPKEYTQVAEKFKKARVLSTATDCKPVIKESTGLEVFVEKSMVEEVCLPNGQKTTLVLENYLLGIVK